VDQSGQAPDIRDPLVKGLLGGVALLGQGRCSLQILPGIVEAGLILGQLRDCLVQSSLERSRVDLDERISFSNHLARGEGNLLDLSVNARSHRNIVCWLNSAEPVQVDREVPPLDNGRVYWSCGLPSLECPLGFGTRVGPDRVCNGYCCPASGAVAS
jgi:hypothetical protein